MATDVDQSPSTSLLTPGEVARIFGVTPKTVGRWEEAGVLPATRTRGGHRRFAAQQVYELLDFLEGVGEA